MCTVKGHFRNGVATPDEPIQGHEGQPVLIMFLNNADRTEDDAFPTLEEIVESIAALGPSDANHISPDYRT